MAGGGDIAAGGGLPEDPIDNVIKKLLRYVV